MTKNDIERIEAKAKVLKLKKSLLYQMAGVSEATWWYWRKGERTPANPDTLRLVEERLDRMTGAFGA